MGCCNSTANDPSSDTPVAESVPVSSATPREPVAEDSSTTLPQRRSRTPLARLLTHGTEMTQSSEGLRRVVSESSLQPSSPSSKIKRANTVQASPSASRHQALTSTVQQVVSNHSKPLKYVVRFWSIPHPSHTSVGLGFSWWGRYGHAKLSQVQVELTPLLITERLGQIFTHQCCLQSGHIGARPVVIVAIFC